MIFWLASRSRACAWGWTQVVITDCGVYTGGAPGAKGGKEKDKDKDKKKKSKSACQLCRAVFHVHPSKSHIPTDPMHGYKTTHTRARAERRRDDSDSDSSSSSGSSSSSSSSSSDDSERARKRRKKEKKREKKRLKKARTRALSG